MLCLLTGSDGSGYSHDYVRRVVLAWAAEKFPRMLPAGRDPAFSFSFEDRGARLTGHSRDDEGVSWAFRCEHPEPGGALRHWMTEVCLQHRDGVDHLGVRNSYFGEPSEAVRSTQPRFLRPLVEHLTYWDGGVRVGVAPLVAQTARAFDNFCDHLQARHRYLPLVVLAPHATPPGEELRYGCNPWPLAQWLCGLAHVVVVAADGNERLHRRFGPDFAAPTGGARVIEPRTAGSRGTEEHTFAPPFEGRKGLADLVRSEVYTATSSQGRTDQFAELWMQCSQ